VQDAKALGKPLLALDTPILREQAPGARFFGNGPQELASTMLEHLQTQTFHTPAPITNERDFAMNFARKLRSVCEEASHAASNNR